MAKVSKLIFGAVAAVSIATPALAAHKGKQQSVRADNSIGADD